MKTLKKGTNIFIFLVLFVSIFIAPGCNKNSSTCNGVPNVAVNFSVDLYSPLYVNLQIPGGNTVVTGGYDNIVVYRYTTTQFYAYDCCCPYDGATNAKAIVQVNPNKLSVTCPVCGSIFLLSDGSVSKGPSKCGLKSYNTTYDGIEFVYVTN